jgi:hypothetical protein
MYIVSVGVKEKVRLSQSNDSSMAFPSLVNIPRSLGFQAFLSVGLVPKLVLAFLS